MASEGPRSPSTVVNLAGAGDLAWTNPSNATASDDSKATCGPLNSGFSSDHLKATGFGFSIPAGATIDGFLVEIEYMQSTTAMTTTSSSDMLKAGSAHGSTKNTGIADAASDTYVSVGGGSSDLWGGTWTASDVNGATFGVRVRLANSGSSGTFSVDHMRITVYYTEAATTKAMRRSLMGVGF